MKSRDQDVRQRGLILVVVLWTVASLSLLLLTINASVRTNNAVARAELITAQVESLTDAGVELAVARLHVRGRQRWRPDGRAYNARFGGAMLRIRITDANGLADLNRSDGEVLYAVFKARLGSTQKAQLLSDWVLAKRAYAPPTPSDAIDRPAPRRSLASPAPFIDVSDLLQNPSMDVQMLASLRDVLTVHSRDGKINPLNAPAALLTVLPGLDDDRTAAILTERTLADRPSAVAELVSRPSSRAPPSSEGPAYRIVVDVRSPGLAKPVTMAAIILMRDDGDAPYYSLSWQPSRF